MQKFTKLTATLSVLLILCLMLSSCSFYRSYSINLPDTPNAEDIKDIPTPDSSLPDAPEKLDFGMVNTFDPKRALENLYAYDYAFNYLTFATSSKNSALFPSTELYLDACAYERNKALEEKFSFKFSPLTDKASTLAQDIANAKKNNTAYADIVAVTLADIAQFEGKDILCDISALPFIGNFADDPYLLIDNEYFVANEASILPSQTRVLFFNKSLLEKSGEDLPYLLLSSKKWTWEALSNYLENGGKLATSDNINKIIEATVKISDTEDEEEDKIAEKVKALIDSVSASVVKEDAKSKFLAGEVLFYLGTFADIIDITSNDTPCGLLPIPLFEEGDEYSDVHNAENVIAYACPKNASNIERSAFMIAAITQASQGSRANAFSKILDGSLLRDNGSRLSLGYIFNADTKIIY